MPIRLLRIFLPCCIFWFNLTCALAQDNWLGGTGNWSNPSNWSLGVPGPTDNAIINSGSPDFVTLDTSASVKSLTVGGNTSVYDSFLSDRGLPLSLTVNNSLFIGRTGFFTAEPNPNSQIGSVLTINGDVNNSGSFEINSSGLPYGSTVTINGNFTNNFNLYSGSNDDIVTMRTLTNSGEILFLGTLNLTRQPHGITDALPGSVFELYGSFTANGRPGFGNLDKVEGFVALSNQNFAIRPQGGTLFISNTGLLDVDSDFQISNTSSAVTISGDVNNSGVLATSYLGDGLNTLTITGTLTNNPGAKFEVNGSTGLNGAFGDHVFAASLINKAYYMYILDHSSLTLSGPATLSNFAVIDLYGSMIVGTGTANLPGYYQFADGTLGEHISMSNFGVINAVIGAVDLNGTLGIYLATGFNPAVGSQYDIITFMPGSLFGTFSSVLGSVFNHGAEKWAVIYDNADGYVALEAQANPVPEPSNFVLLGGGLLTLIGMLRWVPR